MADDAASTSSSDKQRRSLLGLRQLPDDTKQFFRSTTDDTKDFFRDTAHKARNLRHRQSEDSPAGPSFVPESPTSPSPIGRLPPLSRSSTSGRKQLPRIPQQSTPSLSTSKPRLHHVSALRVGLTSLVIYHHTAIPYGGIGNFGWKSAYAPNTSPLLVGFQAINQSFFMAGFFWIAGYFTYSQLRTIAANERRKDGTGEQAGGSTASFVVTRAKRLLVPAIAYTLVVKPLLQTMVRFHLNLWKLSPVQVKQILQTYFTNLRGINGPVWFCALLFIFDAATSTVSAIRPSLYASRPQQASKRPSKPMLLGALATSVLTSYPIRIVYPIGKIFKPLNIQPGLLPQYILAYTLGHLACASNDIYDLAVLPTNPRKQPLKSLAVASLTTLGGIALLVASLMWHTHSTTPSLRTAASLLSGSPSVPALAYALFNDAGLFTILPALLGVCERYLPSSDSFPTISLPSWFPFGTKRTDGREGKQHDLARYAYATFLVHPVVSIGVGLLAERFVLPRVLGVVAGSKGRVVGWGWPVVVTAVVGTVNMIASWGVGIGLLEVVPGLKRWL